MRLTLILLGVLSALTMSVAEVAAQDEDAAENVAEDVEENAPEAKDNEDDDALIYFVCVGALGLTIVITIILVKRALARQRTARELDLAFHPEEDSTLQEELSPFPLFNLGRDPELRNLIVCRDERGQSFDFQIQVRHR